MFVLGPFLDNVIEPFPADGAVAPTAGFQQIEFDSPATTPGGNVHVKLLPLVNPGDVAPINVYAFFVQPVSVVPPLAQRTPNIFFTGGFPSGSVHTAAAVDGKLTIGVSGVKPSLSPYFVQTVLEYPG